MTAMPHRSLETEKGFGAVRGLLRYDALAVWPCLLAGVAAQVLLDRRHLAGLAGALYALSVAVFVGLYRREELEAGSSARSEVRLQRVPAPWAALGVALVLAALAYPQFSGNRLTAWGLWLLAGALGALAASAWPRANWTQWRAALRRVLAALGQGVRLDGWALALVATTALGAWLRLYRLNQIPLEMGPDIPHNVANIRGILGGEYAVFFASHPGREGLFFYLVAPLARALDLSHTTIKLGSALVGIVTIPVIYALGRVLYGPGVGLGAAFFTSLSHWHVILSRSGLRACTVPLFLALAWLWLVRGLQTGRRGFWLLAGGALGLGLHTYNAFVVVPGLLALFLVAEVAAGRGGALRAQWANALLMFVVAAVLYVPMLRYAAEEPAMYAYRTATRLTGIERALLGSVPSLLLGNTVRALLMFNVRGDVVFSTNVPHMRQLGLGASVLFVLGLGWALWRWRRGHNLSVLLALGVLLLPTILALAFPHEVPNAFRAAGSLPPAMLLAGLGLALPARSAVRALGGRSGAAVRVAGVVLGGSLVLALGAEAAAAPRTYLIDFVDHLPGHNYSISLELARAIDYFADGDTYIVTQAHWYDGNAVRAQLRRVEPDWQNEIWQLSPETPPLSLSAGKVQVIVHPSDQDSLGTLYDAYPRGVALTHLDYDGQPAYLTFFGERVHR